MKITLRNPIGLLALFVTGLAATAHSGPLPYVDTVHVSNLAGGPICPGDSIHVFVQGEFPTFCHHFKGIELLPSPIASPTPAPPIVRILVEVDCPDTTCQSVVVPWHGSAILPPLPPGSYNLITQLIVMGPCLDPRPGTPPTAIVPFRVLPTDSCRVSGCFFPWWLHEHGQCDAVISPGRTAHVTLTIGTSVPLAGLQGAFGLEPPGLRITSLEPIGAASGMRLTWTETSEGARFVLFAKDGAPITPSSSGRVPVLRLGLVPGGRPIIPPLTIVSARDMLASDVDGQEVHICPIEVYDVARVCREVDCDVNGDGRADIRDIVLLARCLRNRPVCTTHVDCDGSGSFDLEDVLCCARRVLGVRPCRDCPPDTTQPGEGVSLRFGEPRRAGDGIDVPLVLAGAERLGGARLEIRYPGVFTGSTLTVRPTSGEWLDVGETSPGVHQLGLIRIAEVVNIRAPDPLELTLHLALAPGREPEGEIVLEAEFGAVDGALLDVPFDPALPLGVELAITEPRPNPFAAETRFAVALPRGGPVAITVHDIAGRRVATLFDGIHAAGVLAAGWNGRADRGGMVGNGIYFVRVRAAGATASAKLIRMGAP